MNDENITDIKKAAFAGEKPKGLTIAGEMLYICMRNIYASRKCGVVSTQEAARQTAEAEAAYKKMRFYEGMFEETAAALKQAERLMIELHKKPRLDTAVRILELFIPTAGQILRKEVRR